MRYDLKPVTDLAMLNDLAGLRHIVTTCPLCKKQANCMSGVYSPPGPPLKSTDRNDVMYEIAKRSRLGYYDKDRHSKLVLKFECPECGMSAQMMSQDIEQKACNEAIPHFENQALAELSKLLPDMKKKQEELGGGWQAFPAPEIKALPPGEEE